MNVDNRHVRSVELQKFSDNASDLLLQQDRLQEFFQSVGYGVESTKNGLRGVCPACNASFCHIGVNGRHHRIFWKCFDRACESNAGKTDLCHNLLGLVKGVTEDRKLSTAIGLIAKFLGYEGRSFDITNGKYRHEGKAHSELPPDADDPPF